jgi:hypothetical protein
VRAARFHSSNGVQGTDAPYLKSANQAAALALVFNAPASRRFNPSDNKSRFLNPTGG